MSLVPDGSLESFGTMLAAVSALGTAAFGLVDATKAFRGGVSNIGFNFIKAAVKPYEKALRLVDPADPYATVHANWLNGVPKADQKAAVKALIRLGLTADTAGELAVAAPGVDKTVLVGAARKVADGTELSEQEISVLGRFDATIDAQLDAGFEHADQKFRSVSRVLASVFAIVLAVVGGALVVGDWQTYFRSKDVVAAVLAGLIATPLAPIAKDLTSALSAAVNAFKAVRR